MGLQVLVAHGSNRAFALKEPLEVGPNVRPSIPVAIQWNLAVSLCATPQAPNPPPSFMFNLFPRATFSKIFAACLGGISFRCR